MGSLAAGSEAALTPDCVGYNWVWCDFHFSRGLAASVFGKLQHAIFESDMPSNSCMPIRIHTLERYRGRVPASVILD
jgi:hypothetical protein